MYFQVGIIGHCTCAILVVSSIGSILFVGIFVYEGFLNVFLDSSVRDELSVSFRARRLTSDSNA